MQILYLCFLIPIINRNRIRLYTSNLLDDSNINNNRTLNTTKYNKNSDAALIPKYHIPRNKPIWDRHY